MDKEKIAQAILAIRGARDEADTIAEYLARLAEQPDTSEIEDTYTEIIGDEFNHIIKFTELASELCGIDIPED